MLVRARQHLAVAPRYEDAKVLAQWKRATRCDQARRGERHTPVSQFVRTSPDGRLDCKGACRRRSQWSTKHVGLVSNPEIPASG